VKEQCGKLMSRAFDAGTLMSCGVGALLMVLTR